MGYQPEEPPFEPTYVIISSAHVGAYGFFCGIRKGELVTEAAQVWWASYGNRWVQTQSFPTLHHAMYEAAQFGMNAERAATG